MMQRPRPRRTTEEIDRDRRAKAAASERRKSHPETKVVEVPYTPSSSGTAQVSRVTIPAAPWEKTNAK